MAFQKSRIIGIADMSTLKDALQQVATAGDLDAAELIRYADEDTVGGWHRDESERQWPTGSMWAVEGQFLYALVRALRPALVVEAGTMFGCSAAHILSALLKNRFGKLVSIDENAGSGKLIPRDLRDRWEFVAGNAAALIPSSADIVVEDTDHYEDTHAILMAAKRSKAKLVIAHDAEHYLVGSSVRTSFREVFGEYDTVQIEPGDCGFAYKFTERSNAD